VRSAQGDAGSRGGAGTNQASSAGGKILRNQGQVDAARVSFTAPADWAPMIAEGHTRLLQHPDDRDLRSGFSRELKKACNCSTAPNCASCQ